LLLLNIIPTNIIAEYTPIRTNKVQQNKKHKKNRNPQFRQMTQTASSGGKVESERT